MKRRDPLSIYFVDELLKKSGVEDKFALTHIAIKNIRQLVREKDKNVLLESEKLIILALKKIQKGEEKSTQAFTF
ncbi:DNA-directed RNA polymerase subunit omega [Candidatus Aerophobetes bacterium]|nr:DNA-directed RNA polymerase subunit omega [Candidatus Aerophobetes bacterium]